MITKEQADKYKIRVILHTSKWGKELGYKVIIGTGQLHSSELLRVLPPYFMPRGQGTTFDTKEEAIEYMQIYIYL